LVQFEQRSGDNFAVRFRVWWTEILGFRLLSVLSISAGIQLYPVENMETGDGMNSKKDSKFCDLRKALEIAEGT
jgi:hypothetical protein